MAITWTDAKIAALSLKDLGGKSDRRISVERGLYLRLRRGMAAGKATLSKRWEYRSKVGKKTRWLPLGEYSILSGGVGLSQARAKLDELKPKADKARKGEGEHPVLVARAERRRNLAEPTLEEVAEEWLSMADLRDSTKSLHSSNLKADVYPQIGDARMKYVTAEHLRTCIDAPLKRGKRGQAAQVYKTLRTLVNFALRDRGYITTDPMANVANPKPYNPRKVTPRAAGDEELRVFLELVDKSNVSLAIKCAIEFQLLTGARPGEVRGARWDEIHEARRLWRVPAPRVKTGKAFDVHLSPQAMAVLERARKLESPKDFIFPGLGALKNGKETSGMVSKLATARAMSRLSKQLAEKRIDALRPHDLRRTFRTILSRIGVPPHVAERCLNHVDGNPLDAVYNAHNYRPEMIEAWDRAGAHIEAIRSGAAEVVPLKQSA